MYGNHDELYDPTYTDPSDDYDLYGSFENQGANA